MPDEAELAELTSRIEEANAACVAASGELASTLAIRDWRPRAVGDPVGACGAYARDAACIGRYRPEGPQTARDLRDTIRCGRPQT